MGLSPNYINEEGNAACCVCRKKVYISDVETCIICDKFVCKNCARYRKQGSPYGYVCKKCMAKLDK